MVHAVIATDRADRHGAARGNPRARVVKPGSAPRPHCTAPG